jgi:low affinity Fe/Cu permease
MRRTAKGTRRTRNSYLPTPSDKIRRESPPPSPESRGFGERIALTLTEFTGSSAAFILAALTIVVWAALGPLLGFSENWQLVINTGTTIVTFLMVFLIQRAQNKDSLAIHLKLDELVAAHKGASNRLVSAEELSEDDLERLRREYRRLMRKAAREGDRRGVHSVDEPADAVQTREKPS